MKNRRGFALLTALWLIVAIAIAGAQLAIDGRRARLAAINLTHGLQARAAASAALDLTRARVDYALREATLYGPVEPRLAMADPWLVADSVYSLTEMIGDVEVRIEVRSIGAKLNINRASEVELRNFFTALQLDYSTAEELSQTIMDWRDTDDLYRARGAERDIYEREGRLNLPRNNLFESVEELRYVYGMTEELFELVRPYVTVWGTGRINLNTAEPPVLKSFTAMTDAAVTEIISRRQSSQRIVNVSELEGFLVRGQDLPNNRTAVTVDELEIETTATTVDGRSLVRMFGVIRRGTGQSTLSSWRIE